VLHIIVKHRNLEICEHSSFLKLSFKSIVLKKRRRVFRQETLLSRRVKTKNQREKERGEVWPCGARSTSREARSVAPQNIRSFLLLAFCSAVSQNPRILTPLEDFHIFYFHQIKKIKYFRIYF